MPIWHQVILHDVIKCQNIFGFGLFTASFADISDGLAEEGGPEDAWGGTFYANDCGVIYGIGVFFPAFFSIN